MWITLYKHLMVLLHKSCKIKADDLEVTCAVQYCMISSSNKKHSQSNHLLESCEVVKQLQKSDAVKTHFCIFKKSYY